MNRRTASPRPVGWAMRFGVLMVVPVVVAMLATLTGCGSGQDMQPRGSAEAGSGGGSPTVEPGPSAGGGAAGGHAANAGSGGARGPDDVGNGPDTAAPLGRRSIGNTPLPCELDAVLATSCRGCHGANPGAQSPMALVTYEDLMAESITRPGMPVYELAAQRVASEAAPMPPTGLGRRLTDTELSTLQSWIGAGSPAGDVTCRDDGPPVDTTGSITYEPPSEDEIDKCYGFYAHQNSVPGDAEPFIAGNGEFYTAFYFDVPWEGEKQAILFRSSDSPITHHWLLYDTSEVLPDGTVLGYTTGSHPGAPDLLAAWAINQQREQFVPKEAGLAMPTRDSGRRFLLEVHYFNRGDAVADRSGVEVCLGKNPRPNTATVSWLGTEAIALFPGASLDLTGTCTPQFAEDIYIFRSFPHMHEQGYHLDTKIKRVDGSMETLVDEPFDFNNQLAYDTPAVVHPGDQLLTTCRYQNRSDRLIGVGYDSLSEMCFNFVYAWPARALIGGISLTGTSTPCLL